MTAELDRILADLRRNREKLTELFDGVAQSREEREALFRAVDRILSRHAEAAPADAPAPTGAPPEAGL